MYTEFLCEYRRLLTHFWPMLPFYTSLKTPENTGQKWVSDVENLSEIFELK